MLSFWLCNAEHSCQTLEPFPKHLIPPSGILQCQWSQYNYKRGFFIYFCFSVRFLGFKLAISQWLECFSNCSPLRQSFFTLFSQVNSFQYYFVWNVFKAVSLPLNIKQSSCYCMLPFPFLSSSKSIMHQCGFSDLGLTGLFRLHGRRQWWAFTNAE